MDGGVLRHERVREVDGDVAQVMVLEGQSPVAATGGDDGLEVHADLAEPFVHVGEVGKGERDEAERQRPPVDGEREVATHMVRVRALLGDGDDAVAIRVDRTEHARQHLHAGREAKLDAHEVPRDGDLRRLDVLVELVRVGGRRRRDEQPDGRGEDSLHFDVSFRP